MSTNYTSCYKYYFYGLTNQITLTINFISILMISKVLYNLQFTIYILVVNILYRVKTYDDAASCLCLEAECTIIYIQEGRLLIFLHEKMKVWLLLEKVLTVVILNVTNMYSVIILTCTITMKNAVFIYGLKLILLLTILH